MTNEETLHDDYATPEEKEIALKLIHLESQAHEGALFEDWMRHGAGLKFAKYLESEITLAKNSWLAAEDRQAAENIRIQAQVYAKIKSWIFSQIQTGKVAGTEIKKFSEEGEKLNGLVRLPQRPS